jgi:hypothetical protein
VSQSSLGVRDRLEILIERDLLGPWDGLEEELAGEGPRSRYLIGMIAPRDVKAGPELVDSTLGDADADEGGPDKASPAAASTMFPRSFGLSFAVPQSTKSIRVAASWGRYLRGPSAQQLKENGEPLLVWRRHPVSYEVEAPVREGSHRLKPVPWTDQPDVALRTTCRLHRDRWVIELALVNDQKEPDRLRDEAWLFQPELRVTSTSGDAFLLPQESGRPALSSDDEERRLSMLYRDALEFSVGRNVAVKVERAQGARSATALVTQWMPIHDVPQTVAPAPHDQPLLSGLELDMNELAAMPPERLRAALMPLAGGYERWLDEQAPRLETELDLEPHLVAGRAAIDEGREAALRIRRGIDLISAQPAGIALDAFRFANESMALQRVHTEVGRLRTETPGMKFEAALEKADQPANRSWRPFQLAFILLNLQALADPIHSERSHPNTAVVDLLFFPTGGGKTEAYLGLAAFTFAARRLQGVVGSGDEARDGSDGVAVLMRYTLRLLTAQQFQRPQWYAHVSSCVGSA